MYNQKWVSKNLNQTGAKSFSRYNDALYKVANLSRVIGQYLCAHRNIWLKMKYDNLYIINKYSLFLNDFVFSTP